MRDDVDAIDRLVARAYGGAEARLGWTSQADLFDGERIDAAEVLAIVEDPGQAILVAEDGGAMIGCVQVGEAGHGTGCMELLCVEPRRQGRGVGSRLAMAAEREVAIRFAASAMEMTVIEKRAELIGYYRRRGYLPTGERRPFPVPGYELPLVVLRKSLTRVGLDQPEPFVG